MRYTCATTRHSRHFVASVNRLLVRGESVHQLERVIHTGPIRYYRGRRRDEKIMISGALTLLTNAVIAYNTWKLHQLIERWKKAGKSTLRMRHPLWLNTA